MAKFRFRLQKLLTIREGELSAREGELMLANAKVREIEERIRELISISETISVNVGVILSAEEFFTKGDYAERIRNEIDSSKTMLVQVENEAQLAQEKYIEARKEVRVLEKLREKKLQSFTEEQDRLEQSAMDEMSTMRR